MNETSHFAAKWRDGQKLAPRQLYFASDVKAQVSTAEMEGAWPGVRFRRTLVALPMGKASPLVLDLLRTTGDKPATWDLPLHYRGQITEIGFPHRSNAAERSVLGKANGYQHIWVDATGTADAGAASLTWMLGKRFYTWHMLPPKGAQLILGESGANDPRFNLRREPLLIARASGTADATFVGLLEPHGAYDPSAETVVGSRSTITKLVHARDGDADLVRIDFTVGRSIVLAIADSVDTTARHRAVIEGRTIEWTGHFARFDQGAAR
jgi:hypothetical protein